MLRVRNHDWKGRVMRYEQKEQKDETACVFHIAYKLLDESSACLSRMFFMFFREPVFVTVLNLLWGVLSLLILIL